MLWWSHCSNIPRKVGLPLGRRLSMAFLFFQRNLGGQNSCSLPLSIIFIKKEDSLFKSSLCILCHALLKKALLSWIKLTPFSSSSGHNAQWSHYHKIKVCHVSMVEVDFRVPCKKGIISIPNMTILRWENLKLLEFSGRDRPTFCMVLALFNLQIPPP